MSDADPLRTSIDTYDNTARRFQARKKDRSFTEELLDAFAASLPEHGLVADVGCGPGYDAVGLRSRGLRVVSVDLSRSMLKLAQDVSPGRCVQADIRRLPFAPGGLDGIWSMASLVHLNFDEVEQALCEFRTTLGDAGALLVMVKHVPFEVPRRTPADEDDRRGRGFSGWRNGFDGEDDQRWFSFWNESQFDDALTRAGFRAAGGSTTDAWIRRIVAPQRTSP